MKLSVHEDAVGFSHRVEVFALNKLLTRSSVFGAPGGGVPRATEGIGLRSMHDAAERSSSVEAGRVSHSDLFSPVLYLKNYSPEEDIMLPRLDMTKPCNYTTWAVCRSVLHNFGARTRFRFDIYNGNAVDLLVQTLLVILLVFFCFCFWA